MSKAMYQVGFFPLKFAKIEGCRTADLGGFSKKFLKIQDRCLKYSGNGMK